MAFLESMAPSVFKAVKNAENKSRKRSSSSSDSDSENRNRSKDHKNRRDRSRSRDRTKHRRRSSSRDGGSRRRRSRSRSKDRNHSRKKSRSRSRDRARGRGGVSRVEKPPPVDPEPGAIYDAKVQNITGFGCFVALEGFRRKCEGLVHISQLRKEGRVNSVEEVVSRGQRVKVR